MIGAAIAPARIGSWRDRYVAACTCIDVINRLLLVRTEFIDVPLLELHGRAPSGVAPLDERRR